jgi:hypothetical protein
MRKLGALRVALLIIIALGVPLLLTHTALAADGDIKKVETFLNSITKVITTLATAVGVVFCAIGGVGYMTSSGNPERLERSKKTLLHTGIGLAIVFGALIITNIVSDLAKGAFN